MRSKQPQIVKKKMTEVTLKKYEDKWAIFSNERPIMKSPCGGCLIKLLRQMSEKNGKSYKITVLDSNGEPKKEILLGGGDDRNGKAASS